MKGCVIITVLENLDSFINNYIDQYLWYVAFVLLVGFGIYFTIKLKGVQIFKLREENRLAFKADKSEKGKAISSFEAFCIGLGARVGIGNIAGVATAIMLGGPGAIFWMWTFAIIGAASSFMECTLGQMFKEKHGEFGFIGGPAYYITNGLKKPKFAVFMAMITICAYCGIAGVESANATDAFIGAFDFNYAALIFAILLALVAGIVIFGGIGRVARASYYIVPQMALLWMVIAFVTVIINFTALPGVLHAIIAGAFNLDAAVGATIGTALMWGLRRGVFSNEAGVGSIPNVSSAAYVKHPVKQGLVQSLGVFIDTLVVCSGTAFIILTYGDYSSLGLTGAPLVQSILSAGFLGVAAPAILAFFMTIFAFTNLIACYSITETNVKFISKKNRYLVYMRIVTVFVVFVSCLLPLSLVWDVCDVFMACMGIFNIIAVMLLSKYAFAAYKDYRDQVSAGVKDPIFRKSSLGDMDKSGITTWGDD